MCGLTVRQLVHPCCLERASLKFCSSSSQAETPRQMPPASSENNSMSCFFTGGKHWLIDYFREAKPSWSRKHCYEMHIPLQIQRAEQRFCWKLSVWLGSGTIFSMTGLEQSGGLRWPVPDSCAGPSLDNPCLSCQAQSSKQEWKDPPERLIQNSWWEKSWGNKTVTFKRR